jgi:hypothetical protein
MAREKIAYFIEWKVANINKLDFIGVSFSHK